MKWKVATISVAASAAALADSDTLTAAIQTKVNELRHDWAGLQPILNVDAELKAQAQSAAAASAVTCVAAQHQSGAPFHYFETVGATQWACKGTQCASLPIDQAAVDWANQASCYEYAPFGSADSSCEGVYVHDFTQLFWDSLVLEGEGSTARYLCDAPTSIGCAAQSCANEEGMVVVCHYGPGGNAAGQLPFCECPLAQLNRQFPGMSTTTTTTTTTPAQEVDRVWMAGVVDAINEQRAELGKLPPLNINEDLVQFAQHRANQNAGACKPLDVSDEERSNVGPFALVGETKWSCIGQCEGLVENGLIAVNDWISHQAQCYQWAPFGSPEQQSPTSTYCSYQTKFYDFTQILWTTETDSPNYGRVTDIGCSKALCFDDNGNHELSFQMVCSYGPSGNLEGEYPFSAAEAEEIAKTHQTVYPPV